MQTIQDIAEWANDLHESARNRLGITGMTPEKRNASITELEKIVPTRIQNGLKHFLLHRSFGNNEAKQNLTPETYNSLTPRNFGNQQMPAYTSWSHKPMVPKMGKYSPKMTHIVSAWIPESHVSFYFPSYANDVDKYLKPVLEKEKETVVKPGEFKVEHHSDLTTKPVKQHTKELIQKLKA
jgi:hypothetical protein